MPSSEPSPKTLQEVSSAALPDLEKSPGKKDNWVEKTGPGGAGGKLPDYIERVARHLQAQGYTTSHAVAAAVNTIKRWATGTNHNGSRLKPDTIAKAQAALAQWEALKAKSHVQEAKVEACELSAEDRSSLAGALLYRLSLAEGFAQHLKGARTRGKSGAVASAKALLEGSQAKMTLGRGNVDSADLARTQSRLGVEISELQTTLDSLDLYEATAFAETAKLAPGIKAPQRFRQNAKGRNGQSIFDESKHPRATKGRTGGGQFIKKGSTGPEVKGIQQRLGVRQDGQFGKETAKAVRGFQEKRGLTVDGKVGAQTAAAMRGAEALPGPLLSHHRKQMRKLSAGDRYSPANLAREDAAEKARNKAKKARKEAKKKAESSASSSSTKATTTGTGSAFGSGSSLPSKVVDLIQRKLGTSTTGQYDEATKKRIEAFQKAHGLQVDGIVGTQTLAALRGDETPPEPGVFTQSDWEWLTKNQAGGQRGKRLAKQKKDREAREEKREARIEKQLAEAEEKKGKRAVKDDHLRGYGAGMAGAPDEATAHLQNRLTELGYDVGPADGRFGERTQGAVEAFQGEHNLKKDGEVGPNTKVALRGTDTEEVTRRRSSTQAVEPEEEAPEEQEETKGEQAPMPKLAGAVLTKGAGIDSDKPDPSISAMQKAVGVEGDGWFGPETEKKLKATQRKYGLKSDGVVGPKTGRLLDRLNTKADASAKKDERDLAEAVLDRMEAYTAGNSSAFIRARAREQAARDRLVEASARSAASDLLRDFYRLDDGTFAPKGLGRVLRPGEEIHLPHRSGKGTVRARVEAGEGGKGLARIMDGPDKGRLAGVRTAAPTAKESHSFPKPLKGRPAALPNMKRNAGWGEKDKYDALNSEAKAQSALDQMNHHMAAGDHQAVEDHVSDAKGEADWIGAHSPNAAKRYEELEGRGNHFLEHGTDPDEVQRAPIDFSDASDAELNTMMDEATSHMEGVPMTARNRSVFQAVIQERAHRAKVELRDAKSSSAKEKAASLIAALTGKRPEGVPQPQYAPPEGYQANDAAKQLKDMAPGDTFYIGKYDTPFVLHKSVNDPYFVAKPVGGGKAQPFHKEMAPTFLGPHNDSYPGPSSASTPPADSGDLFQKLKDSVEKDSAAPATSPARSTSGNLRNFKAMNDEKLMGLALEMKSHPQDVEAVKAITAELNTRFKDYKAKTEKADAGPVTVVPAGKPEKGYAIPPPLGKTDGEKRYELVSASLTGLKGEKVRVTWPNGTTKAGDVGSQTLGGTDYPTVGGTGIDGSYANAMKIEQKIGSKYKAVHGFPLPENYSGYVDAQFVGSPSTPKTHEPAVNKSKDEKIAAAWGAYDKKKAEFDALPANASKAERSKKAAQVRAAKFRIKRVGGDPDKKPEGSNVAAKPTPKAKETAPDAFHQKIDSAWSKMGAEKVELPMSVAEIKVLVSQVPEGGYGAAFGGNQTGAKALQALDSTNHQDLVTGLKKVADQELARLYLTAEDSNYHTLNEKVGDELTVRGIGYPEFEAVAEGISPEQALKNSQRETAEITAQEKAAVAAVVSADQKPNLKVTSDKLGGLWTGSAVDAALDQLEEQGLTFDREKESPDTLAAVIKAAGLDPANLKTQGTV